MAEYNGWTNWETWHTALLIDNERDLYDKKVELVKKKASIAEFKRELKKAETMTRKFVQENREIFKDDKSSSWHNKFEAVNWAEIHKNAMAEDYS
jgi:hypothetical protein